MLLVWKASSFLGVRQDRRVVQCEIIRIHHDDGGTAQRKIRKATPRWLRSRWLIARLEMSDIHCPAPSKTAPRREKTSFNLQLANRALRRAACGCPRRLGRRGATSWSRVATMCGTRSRVGGCARRRAD